MYDDSWSSDGLTWRRSSENELSDRVTEMRRELGRRESPAFERLREYLHTPCDISATVIADIVGMLRPRCFADSQSYRQTRGATLWAELHWLNENMLIETFSVMLTSRDYTWWKASTLAQHPSAGPALWARILSQHVDARTVVDINNAMERANQRDKGGEPCS